jgi:glyoxylate reductase
VTPPTIFLSRTLPPAVLASLEGVGTLRIWAHDRDPTPADLVEHLAGAEAMIAQLTDRIDAALLDAAPSLRIVANVAVGYNNIDVAAAHARRVVITNTPDVLTEASATLTWSLILGITRRIVEGDRLVRAGQWIGWAPGFMLGVDLAGRELGIVGMGRIGQAVAAKAAVFGMRVSYAVSPRQAGRAPIAGPAGIAYTPKSLDDLLASADVVALHVPLNRETQHLIGRRELALMKPTAYLINVARGPVVDEAALAHALGAGLIAGAGLDVYEHEPTVHAGLLDLPNVVLSPHLGSATHETRTAMAQLAADNVAALVSGRPPLTPVAGSYLPGAGADR